ncbi:MAG: dual specificity protein phosphatase family protein, partial [Pseudomonadota bacterium]
MQPNLPSKFKFLDEKKWKIFPGKLAGSSQPNSSDNLIAIYAQGIKSIYNLVPAKDKDPTLIKSSWESRFMEAHYITEINNVTIAIEDFKAPTQEQLHLITDDVIVNIKKGKNILVHCRAGMGRTGTILAAIYMKACQKYDSDEAIECIRVNYSPHAIETSSQENALKIFGENLSFCNH